MPTLWYDLELDDLDDEPDELDPILPEDKNADDEIDRLINLDDDEIYCIECGALVEDGFQCDICGLVVEK